MNSEILHDRLNNRYCIAGTLKVATPLCISAGVADDATDAPFILDSTERPYIPGTSFRGAVRAELERWLAGPGSDITGLNACCLFGDEDCVRTCRDDLKEIGDEPDEQRRNNKMVRLIEHKLCDLCRLFGNTMLASRIYFADCYCPHAIEPIVRDGVGIDRDSGAAVDGAKYDYEVLDPGDGDLRFDFTITVENVTDQDKKIVGLMLRLLNQGVNVGGKRAAGLGRLQMIADPTIIGFADAQTAWRRLSSDPTGAGLMQSIDTDWKEMFPC